MSLDEFTGRVLDTVMSSDGYHVVKLDNGADKVINVAVPGDTFERFMAGDLKAIHLHLVTQRKGRYRVKKARS